MLFLFFVSNFVENKNEPQLVSRTQKPLVSMHSASANDTRNKVT